jgi:hypothetical protein
VHGTVFAFFGSDVVSVISLPLRFAVHVGAVTRQAFPSHAFLRVIATAIGLPLLRAAPDLGTSGGP